MGRDDREAVRVGKRGHERGRGRVIHPPTLLAFGELSLPIKGRN